tara:strand:+ start:107 stop:583 length:477 start_codon:yes stop_codon:yes gene_type:complete
MNFIEDIDEDLNIIKEDLIKIENDISKKKINIIILFVDNKCLEKTLKKSQDYINNISKKLIESILLKVKEKYCKKDYKIKYLLNFNINCDSESLSIISRLEEKEKDKILKDEKNKIYNLESLNNLNNIDKYLNEVNIDNFNKKNSIIILLEKIYYIKK